MTRIHTITYDQAKKWYDSGRKYKLESEVAEKTAVA